MLNDYRPSREWWLSAPTRLFGDEEPQGLAPPLVDNALAGPHV
jgi:hypothetical protein